MPKNTAAGERTARIRLGVAASACVATALTLLVAGCGEGGGASPWAEGSAGSSRSLSPSPAASATAATAPTDELTEPTDADTEFDDDTSLYDPYPDDTDSFYDDYTWDSGLYPTLPNASPYQADTCFDGPHITSTTPIDVYDMNEVSCSSSDAHYKVVKTILDSTDLDACNDVDDAEYAFSESDTDEYGVTTWNAVYCLVGLGSYAAD